MKAILSAIAVAVVTIVVAASSAAAGGFTYDTPGYGEVCEHGYHHGHHRGHHRNHGVRHAGGHRHARHSASGHRARQCGRHGRHGAPACQKVEVVVVVQTCGAGCFNSGRRNFPHALTIARKGKNAAKRVVHARKHFVHRVVRLPHGKPMPHARAKPHHIAMQHRPMQRHHVAHFGLHRAAGHRGGMPRHMAGGHFGKFAHAGHAFSGGKPHIRRGKPGH